MAIYAKTLSEVKEVADAGQESLNLLQGSLQLDTDNLVDKVINELSAVIDKLQQKQSDFLNMFGCSSTEEFEARVAAYYRFNNLTTFTGTQLRSIINDFKKAQDSDSKKTRQMLDQMLNNIQNDTDLRNKLENRVLNLYGKILTKNSPAYFMQLIAAGLSQVGLGGGGTLKFSASQVVKGSTNNTGEQILEIAANEASAAFLEHLYDMEKKYRYGSLKNMNLPTQEKEVIETSKQLLRGLPKKPQISSNKATISLGVMWSEEVTNLMRKVNNDTSKLKGTPELRKTNEMIRDKIINTLNIENPRFRTFATNRINEMLAQDDLMFMVGSSYTQVEGILGEINTMIAISHLLGENFTSKIVNWIGSQKVGQFKRQPSIDIVLGDIAGIRFGLQVKNTMADLNIPDIAHEIGFANKSIQETFNQLGVGSDEIENVYIADVYNVPYKREGNQYVQVGYGTPFVHNDATAPRFHEYTEIDKRIDNIVKDINTILTMFAPDFLYMGLGDSFKSKLATLDSELDKVGGNYVYIVGPKVYFAYNMLTKLVEQLKALQTLQGQEQQMNFKLEAYFGKLKGETTSFNIVSDLNNFGGEGGSKHTIKMRSSWLFD